MCHLNLDLRRPNIEKHAGKKYSIPVIYITQALGLALGIAPEKLGLQRHTVAVKFSPKGTNAPSGTVAPSGTIAPSGTMPPAVDRPAVAKSSGSKTMSGEK
jgi:hypothetical protein